VGSRRLRLPDFTDAATAAAQLLAYFVACGIPRGDLFGKYDDFTN
jgi:hypothetical protein